MPISILYRCTAWAFVLCHSVLDADFRANMRSEISTKVIRHSGIIGKIFLLLMLSYVNSLPVQRILHNCHELRDVHKIVWISPPQRKKILCSHEHSVRRRILGFQCIIALHCLRQLAWPERMNDQNVAHSAKHHKSHLKILLTVHMLRYYASCGQLF